MKDANNIVISNKELQEGDIIKFTEATNDQIRWGNNDDPRKLLIMGDNYEIEKVEIHSWHAKIYLKGIKGKFNSVHFTKQ